MKHVTMIRLCLAAALPFLTAHLAQAQGANSRSAQPISIGSALSPTGDLPCAGTPIFEENFESGLIGWTVIDGDGRTPNAQMQLTAGWQPRQDYRDTSNHVAVSPSWYSPIGNSNDWLISPPITVGSNSCLSWVAYSQDGSYLEAYEIRLAATPDTSAMLVDSALVTVASAPAAKTLRSVSLADYAGQTVHIAFRQTSQNKFVLALDDIKVSNVNTIDIGVYAVTVPSSDPGDTIALSIEVANYGSDTVRDFDLSYQVEAGAIQTMTLDSIVLAPNKTLTVTHRVKFVSDTIEAFYDYCAWTALPNGVADQGIVNDSLCDRFAVGTPVGMADAQRTALDMRAYPVPAHDRLYVQVRSARPEHATATLYDLQGRAQRRQAMRLGTDAEFELDVNGLSAGIYLLQVQTASGKRATEKISLR